MTFEEFVARDPGHQGLVAAIERWTEKAAESTTGKSGLVLKELQRSRAEREDELRREWAQRQRVA